MGREPLMPLTSEKTKSKGVTQIIPRHCPWHKRSAVTPSMASEVSVLRGEAQPGPLVSGTFLTPFCGKWTCNTQKVTFMVKVPKVHNQSGDSVFITGILEPGKFLPCTSEIYCTMDPGDTGASGTVTNGTDQHLLPSLLHLNLQLLLPSRARGHRLQALCRPGNVSSMEKVQVIIIKHNQNQQGLQS